MSAALDRGDLEITGRMEYYTDLFALDAKYHRSCYSKYISKRNISSFKRKVEEVPTNKDPIEDGMLVLFSEIRRDIIEGGKTTTYGELNNRLQEIMDEMDLEDNRDFTQTATNLRRRLEKAFKNQLAFVSRDGKPTVIHAISAQYEVAFSGMGSNSDEEDSSSGLEAGIELNIENEMLILHKAAGILRSKILAHTSNISKLNYITPQDLNESECRKDVPNELYDFISWILNPNNFMQFPASSFDVNVIAICSSILNSIHGIPIDTTFGLSLSVLIYQTVRSKKIVDILYRLGYGSSYDEIRKLLTSLTTQQLENNNEGVFIPQGLNTVKQEENNFMHASIDNFDQNEETIDGKSTTHSMAMVLFQRKENRFHEATFKRQTKKSLKELDDCNLEQKLNVFQKPPSRPEPTQFDEQIVQECFNTLQNEDKITTNTLWRILRYKSPNGFLGWKEFNEMISSNNLPVANVLYYPFINAPPSSYDTIYTALVQLSTIADKIGQKHVVVTADLAIYSKAREILWSSPSDLGNRITMQLGGMHLTMAYIASIGQIFGDGGLINLLVESGVYAEISCRQMLQGKHLYRALRGLTLVSDVLSRLFFKSMMMWMEKYEGQTLFQNVSAKFDYVHNILRTGNVSKSLMEDVLNECEELKGAMDDFIKFGSQRSATFKYWLMFIEAVDILLKLQRAERNADFTLHLDAVRQTLPYLEAGGRNNYAKYTPVYLLDMYKLKEYHPETFKYLPDGNFVVRRTASHKFNCVASDMALEQTLNKDCKSSAGVIGFTKSGETLEGWLVTRHLLGEYTSKMESLIQGITRKYYNRAERDRSRDEDDVKKMLALVETTWINPFDNIAFSSDLIHIATGKIASDTIKNSLLTFKETANANNIKFVQERLQTGQVSFWKSSPRFMLKAFGSSNVRFTNIGRDKGNFGNPEFMFRRIISAAEFKNMDFADVLSYELTPVPLSLFHDDGSMRKTCKAELAKKLETFCGELSHDPPIETQLYIIDGMALLQGLNEKSFKTFENLGDIVLKKILKNFQSYVECQNISIIFDSYDFENTVKSGERLRRGERIKIGSYSIVASRNVPNYREFLKSNTNKSSLVVFVKNYLKDAFNKIPEGKKVVIAGGLENGETCITITKTGFVADEKLKCNHEEADTRIIFHLAQTRYANVVVKSDDTDVLVLLLYYYHINNNINKMTLFLEKGHSSFSTNKKGYIPIHILANKLGNYVCTSLPSLHSLTGCDTTNACFKVGKKIAFNTLLRKEGQLQLNNFGKSSVTKSTEEARKLILFLYKQDKAKDLNDARLTLTMKTKRSAKEIPPTKDAFQLHALRCYYQVKIWINSENGLIEPLDPLDYRWINHESILSPKFLNKPPIPPTIRKAIQLFCNGKKCNSNKCECKREGMFCTPECKCKMECENIAPENNLELSEDEEY